MKERMLIAYHIVHVTQGQSFSVTSQSVFSQDDNVLAIELQGNDMLLLGRACMFWYGRTPEITYRQHPSGKACVVFSRLSDDGYFRSADIIGLPVWPEAELVALTQSQALDKTIERDLFLDQLGAEQRADPMNTVRAFLWGLYSINPQKQHINLRGKVSPYLFLLAVSWFALGGCRDISYEGQPLL